MGRWFWGGERTWFEMDGCDREVVVEEYVGHCYRGLPWSSSSGCCESVRDWGGKEIEDRRGREKYPFL